MDALAPVAPAVFGLLVCRMSLLVYPLLTAAGCVLRLWRDRMKQVSWTNLGYGNSKSEWPHVGDKEISSVPNVTCNFANVLPTCQHRIEVVA